MDDLIARARTLEGKDGTYAKLMRSVNYSDVPTHVPELNQALDMVTELRRALEAERKARAGFDIQAQDLRDRVVQLNQELATSRGAHEVTAQERDRATTELAIMRAWVAQARPVIEAVREWQRARLSVLSSGVDDYASRVSDFGTAQNRIMTIALPPKETP